MSADSNFTPAQDDAIESVGRLLREHFEGSVIIVIADSDIDGTEVEVSETFFHGGAMLAKGLCFDALERLRDRPNLASSDE